LVRVVGGGDGAAARARRQRENGKRTRRARSEEPCDRHALVRSAVTATASGGGRRYPYRPAAAPASPSTPPTAEINRFPTAYVVLYVSKRTGRAGFVAARRVDAAIEGAGPTARAAVAHLPVAYEGSGWKDKGPFCPFPACGCGPTCTGRTATTGTAAL
jgi:hypothetical protein